MAHRRSRRQTRVDVLALAIGFVLASGCGPSDPLEQVRALQDEEKDFPGSLEPLRELIEARPDEPEVHYRYGAALIATGDVGFAVWPLKKAMESPEWREKAGMALAAARLAQGAHDEAIEICTRILEDDPDNIPVLLQRATAYAQSRRDYEHALADAERVLELEPDNVSALQPRALALLGLGRVEEAAEALEDLEAIYRDDSLQLRGSPALCMARATFAQEKGEIELAEERFEGCLEAFPDDAPVVSGVAAFFDAQGRPERAEEILAEMLERNPDAEAFRTALALRIAASGRVDEAEELLREGTEAASRADAAEAWADLASFNVDHGDLDDALEAFARALELDTGRSPQLLLAYADALLIAKRFDEAEALIQTIEVEPYRLALLGRMELERGNPAAALERFTEAQVLWPNNAIARYYTAIAAEQLGDFARATEEYRYAMRIDVKETDAYLRLARLQAATGADEAAFTTLEFQPNGRPEEVAAGLLEMRILARMGRQGLISPRLHAMMAAPEHRGAAAAALAEGVRERSGPEAAVEAMRAAKLDLRDPLLADALSAMVENLAAAGRPGEGLALVDEALGAHRDVAAFHALRGRALVLTAADAASAREAFERALALDAENGVALVGLARLEREAGSGEAALALYRRAIAADANDRAAAREAALVMVALGRPAEAEEQLASLLREHPYDADAARSLAELRFARGVADERTRELARRAVTFGGGAEAKALLARVAPSAEKENAAKAVAPTAGEATAESPEREAR